MEVISRDERMEVRMEVFIQMSSNTGWRRAIMRACSEGQCIWVLLLRPMQVLILKGPIGKVLMW
jgi:hypothetical protein